MRKEITYVLSRMKELDSEALTDLQKAQIIAKELGRPSGSLNQKIIQLKKKGVIEKKRKNFTKDEDERIISLRNSLAAEGLSDKKIAKRLVGAVHRSMKSIYHRINFLIENEKLGENPNKRMVELSENDVETIIRRRTELLQKGLKDGQIARIISVEIKRPAKCVDAKIRELVRSKRLEENPNKMNDFSKEETESIVRRIKELMPEKLKNLAIARIIAKETGRSIFSITQKMARLVDEGQLEDNLGKRVHRNWSSMNKDELVAHTRKFMDERGICSRSELQGADLGLYTALRYRNLLDRVFPSPAKKSESELLSQLKDAVELYLGKGEGK